MTRLWNAVTGVSAVMILAAASWPAAAEWSAAEVRDRAMIEDTMARYMYALDTADADAYAAVYAEDGEFVAGDFTEKGRDALRQYVVELRERWGLPEGRHWGRTRHIFYNFTVDVDGDTAQGQSYWQTLVPDPEGGPWRILATGVSEDSFVKVDGEWLIQRRVVIGDPRSEPAAAAE